MAPRPSSECQPSGSRARPLRHACRRPLQATSGDFEGRVTRHHHKPCESAGRRRHALGCHRTLPLRPPDASKSRLEDDCRTSVGRMQGEHKTTMVAKSPVSKECDFAPPEAEHGPQGPHENPSPRQAHRLCTCQSRAQDAATREVNTISHHGFIADAHQKRR